MDFIDLPPLLSAQGVVQLPGSKSISNRVLLLSALAGGVTEVRDLLESDDTARMLDALRALGIAVESLGDRVYRIHGVAGNFPCKRAELFLGNAGTAFRSLTAALALAGGHYTLTGVARMHERPIGDLVDALRELGADIRYLENEGFPPLEIRPSTIRSRGHVQVRGDLSSQFLTGLLMALPLTGTETTIEVVGDLISKPYIEITLATMARFGVEVVREGWQRFIVPAGDTYRSPGVVYVEADASSASYFLALGAIGGGPLRVAGVGCDSVQGDVRFADALAQMGARIETGSNWIAAAAPPSGKLRGISLDCKHIPDAAMTLATTALFAEGPTTLTHIASWRVKETDRIEAMATELRKLGAEVQTGADFIRVIPRKGDLRSPDAGIDTYDDHRIAMCFSLVSLASTLRINDPACVSKTFPEYFAAFAKVTRPVPVIAIDGPSASGKGTVAARVAAALGWHYLDSGALYRLTALACRRAGVSWRDEARVAAIAAGLDVVFGENSIRLSGDEVNDAIRDEEISSGASQVAALPTVRNALLFRQRLFRQAPGLVADGRDMASVVFPDAQTKVFLTASVEVRAERRHKQLIEKGIAASILPLLQDLRERDQRDSRRSVAPLQQSEDAMLLDTTDLTIEQAVDQVLLWSRKGS
ncbi:bifunctional 3-phosphoshikimate 1-carboxyvinyltransferase/cytidylate kinase [Propionivibrio sp.]|uniref:bifunctional 3-phosphoshikimate 1-carboxyvinyltransferase/cytidylate kinase n=1 Tax=Propionivibrio sp. TaxID=2212460 RepID=UPI0025F68D2B|nr:bifunctional 3-phosphoshikimate 1-carboxyvinyltransferase/cytidylate kinase [Propionivibrio sp.]MBK7356970.1 bifunctional 3-phosphoshikimate 1-carboxyvinyltransferase/cytidylate kinase [Propionivibrio sp.]MBK8401598.1 bifunctional 3-phosphoshikimate 1-carboxyvinyltransferase/cytidylate kinase [Propionivibrio sp.]MBK8745243.1 bifunctional 3-phosphoshikimate 1-carboxyvinyltransferase/cytidylate kinase [Propionivibrio sp.]MBK8893989.1 bifunctional 3-phosphoshikimate 1-carboxyvinyltransferase/cy